jgi:uroporphyrinogen decarboxylase
MMSELTGRERLLRTFHQQSVDRAPVAPFIHINYVREFFGSHDVDYVEKTPEVYRHFGLDLIHRNCTPSFDPWAPEGPEWHVESTTEKQGRDENTTRLIHTPGGLLHLAESLRWGYEYDAENSITEYPIRSEADLELLMRHQPKPAPTDVSCIQRAREAIGEEGIIAPWIQGAFNLVAFYYRKLDDLLTDALSDPTFYHRLIEYCLGRYMIYVQELISAGVDVLSYGGNIANGKLVGPDFFRTFIWPYEKRLIDFVQSQGVAVLYHNCGYARRLMPLYPSLGMHAYESLTPPPYGDTALAEAIEIFGRNTTLSGNIDQLDLLRKGTIEEIRAAVRETLDTARGKCHFILATTDYFNESTPHDHIHALAEAGLRYGRY